MAKRNAQGAGSIRQRSNGTWEGRFTYLDELGQTRRSSVYGRTQKEARQKLTAILREVDTDCYHGTTKKRYSVAEWLDIWLETYCTDLKPMTISGYKSKINSRIKPNLGNAKINSLTNVQIQRFYNKLATGDAKHKPLSPKSIQNIHGILHKSMEQATVVGLIAQNPCDHAKIPTVKKAALSPLMDENITLFLKAIEGDKYERLFKLDLFSGLRQSEILGLEWQDVDFENGLIHVCRQLQRNYETNQYIFLDETKNGKDRIVAIAPSIVAVLREQKRQQAMWQLAAGDAWDNPNNLIFTDTLGGHLKHFDVYRHFKKIVASIGMPNCRFHDLRHSYAINALQCGDNPKVVSEQLGHYSTAFTMDVYGSVSETMRKDSQDRMENYILKISKG